MAESGADSESELYARSLCEGHQESTSSCNEQCSTSDTSVPSLLSRLKAPKPSDLARKRRTDTNPPVGKKRGRGSETYDPKTVSALERVKAYPLEPFSVSNKKLFCSGCREELSLKKSTIELHIKSTKHLKGKERLEAKEKREKDIAKALQQYDLEVHPSGETLPLSTCIHRVNVVTTLMKAGIPLSKVDSLRELLEENSHSLTDSAHLRSLVPLILQGEIDELKRDIHGKSVSIVFDGTTHVCEAFVVVLRYVDDWAIKQRVCRLMLLAKSITGEEVARQLVTILSNELSISPDKVVGAMRDRASVNNVAMRTISVIFNRLMDMPCFSHTIDHVGQHMNIPILEEFMKYWISLFSHSPKARLAWKTQTSLSVRSYSQTRWWSKFEMIHQLHDTFGDVPQFLQSAELPITTTAKLLRIIDDQPTYWKFKVELATTVDAMLPFVKATYSLEGDGPLALQAYQIVSSLYHHISLQHYPNLNAVARQLSQGSVTRENQLVAYGHACCAPAYAFFKAKFDEELRLNLFAFKTARYFSPTKVNELKPSATDLDTLSVFPFMTPNLIGDLKNELPKYLAEAEDISDQVDPLSWWKTHEEKLPTWSEACKLVLLLQPSSAAAERVFSILSSTFSSSQESSLEDYVQVSVMLQYNHHR